MPIKNSRMGKRGPNSSSSSFSPTMTMVVFVAVSILVVWFFTSSSSSVVPPNAVSAVSSRVHSFPDRLTTRLSLSDYKDTDSPPALDDTQGELPEDAVKDDENLQAEKVSKDSNDSSEQEQEQQQQQQQQQQNNKNDQSEENEIRSEEQQQKSQVHSEEQQDNDVTNEQQVVQNDDRSSEEQQQHQQNSDVINELQDKSNSEEQQQQNSDVSNEQQDKNNSEEQQQNVNINNEQQQEQSNDQNSEEQLRQQNADVTNEQQEERNSEEQQQNVNISGGQLLEQSNDQNSEEKQQENTDVTEEPKMETSGGEEISTENVSNDDQQEFHPEIDEKVQRHIEEGEGGGMTSQSQVMHDTEGISEEQQQSQESNESGQQRSEDNPNGSDSFPDTSREEVSGEKGKTWRTQADQSVNENERRKEEQSLSDGDGGESGGEISNGAKWELCNVTAGSDYIPCLDNEMAIKKLHSSKHFEHRERHCPEESPTCLVQLPEGYKRPIEWPQSRDRIWYSNVPHTKLAEVKGHQNWVKVTGEYLTFPGGGTQFIHGALHYIDFIEKSARPVSWRKHTRVILDVGCGVASFGGYLFERDVLAMSFAPKDEHEAQVQFALERGIPAISAVMGSQRLPFPSRVFDIVHCARCRVPWHADGGALLLELNRVLRPGGFFVWSATPVYQKLEEDVQIWNAMTSLTISMCWDLYTIQKDKLNGVGAAFYRKPISNDCYKNREDQSPPLCKEDDNPNAAWYVPLQSCIHPVPTAHTVRGSRWPEEWPQRLVVPPYWLNRSQLGVYGKPEPEDFKTDYEHWKNVVTKSYLTGFGIDWSKVRNVMDMRAVYGGFAAALRDLKVWVMNVVNIDSPDTLPLIYERGLFGIYHDWCESFSTYPRTYDLLHADHLFSQLMRRCTILPVVVEVDRIVRPGGKLIIRDESRVVTEVENLLKSLHWEIRLKFSKNQEGMLCAEKSDWRPEKHLSSF